MNSLLRSGLQNYSSESQKRWKRKRNRFQQNRRRSESRESIGRRKWKGKMSGTQPKYSKER